MARNKYPEETVKKILNTAISLFLENGYEKTSMQDIVNALGMSCLLYTSLSPEDVFFRMSGDEFIILMYGCGEREASKRMQEAQDRKSVV